MAIESVGSSETHPCRNLHRRFTVESVVNLPFPPIRQTHTAKPIERREGRNKGRDEVTKEGTKERRKKRGKEGSK